jgi:hypothetical protein
VSETDIMTLMNQSPDERFICIPPSETKSVPESPLDQGTLFLSFTSNLEFL